MKNKKNWLILGLIIVSAFLCWRVGNTIWHNQQTLDRLHKQEKILRKHDGVDSVKSGTIKEVMTKGTVGNALDQVKKFFYVAYDWSSGKQYNLRVKTIENLDVATDDILKNQYLFEDIGGMGDYIDNNGLISRVKNIVYYPKQVNDHNADGVVVVTVVAKRQSDVGNGDTKNYYFDMSYDADTNKITNVAYQGKMTVNQSSSFDTFNPYG